MKKSLFLTLITTALCAQAQEPRAIDFTIASEVVRGLTSERTGQEILQSTNLLANYRDIAIQQELAVEAVRRGLTERMDVQRNLEQYRRQVLVAALRQDVARSVPAPDNARIESAFKSINPPPELPAGYQLDAWIIPPSDTQSLAVAKTLVSGKAVADETVARIQAPMIVSKSAGAWVTASQINSNVWQSLAGMIRDEVRIFPDGSNTMVIRRGDARAARPLTLEEARPQLILELNAQQANENWQRMVLEKARALGLPETP